VEPGPRTPLPLRAFTEGAGLLARWEFHALVWLFVLGDFGAYSLPSAGKWVSLLPPAGLAVLAAGLGAGVPLRAFASPRGILGGVAAAAGVALALQGEWVASREEFSGMAIGFFLQEGILLAFAAAGVAALAGRGGLPPLSRARGLLAVLPLAVASALAQACLLHTLRRSTLPLALFNSSPPFGRHAVHLLWSIPEGLLVGYPALLLGRWMLLAAGGEAPREDPEGGDA